MRTCEADEEERRESAIARQSRVAALDRLVARQVLHVVNVHTCLRKLRRGDKNQSAAAAGEEHSASTCSALRICLVTVG